MAFKDTNIGAFFKKLPLWLYVALVIIVSGAIIYCWAWDSDWQKLKLSLYANKGISDTAIKVVTAIVIIWGLVVATRRAKTADKEAATHAKGINNSIYSSAVEAISSDKPYIIMGGMLSLKQLANEYPDEYLITVMELMTGFIREYAAIDRETKKPKHPEYKKYLLIVRHATIYMGELTQYIDNENLKTKYRYIINLIYVDLQGVYLRDANLKSAALQGANLTDAFLVSADFTGARLDDANLTEVKFNSKLFIVDDEEATPTRFPADWGELNGTNDEFIFTTYGEKQIKEFKMIDISKK